MIDHIWREQLALADRLFCVGAERRLGFTAVRSLEAARRTAISLAKALRDGVRKARTITARA
jgi:hypothetical protein